MLGITQNTNSRHETNNTDRKSAAVHVSVPNGSCIEHTRFFRAVVTFSSDSLSGYRLKRGHRVRRFNVKVKYRALNATYRHETKVTFILSLDAGARTDGNEFSFFPSHSLARSTANDAANTAPAQAICQHQKCHMIRRAAMKTNSRRKISHARSADLFIERIHPPVRRHFCGPIFTDSASCQNYQHIRSQSIEEQQGTSLGGLTFETSKSELITKICEYFFPLTQPSRFRIPFSDSEQQQNIPNERATPEWSSKVVTATARR